MWVQTRRRHFLDWFEQAGYSRIVTLETFAENAEFLKAKASSRTPALEVTHGDIRDKDVITGDAFDMYYPFEMQNYIFLQMLASILHKRLCVINFTARNRRLHPIPTHILVYAISLHTRCIIRSNIGVSRVLAPKHLGCVGIRQL